MPGGRSVRYGFCIDASQSALIFLMRGIESEPQAKKSCASSLEGFAEPVSREVFS